MTLLLISAALADPGYPADALQARAAEVAPLRDARLYKAAPAPSTADLAALAGGGRVGRVVAAPGEPTGRVYGAAILDVPIDTLWRALNDELAFVGTTVLSYARVVQGPACGSDRYGLMVMDIPVLDDRWFINHNTHNSTVYNRSGGTVRELAWWSTTDPAQIALNAADQAATEDAVFVSRNEGAWWLVQLSGDRVLAEYTSLTDPGGSVPAGPTATFSKGALNETFDGMLAMAKSGKLRCK